MFDWLTDIFQKPLAALTLWDLIKLLGALFVGYLVLLFATLLLAVIKEGLLPPKR
jgi:hypothetical protein